MTIRTATLQDLDHIVKIEQECFPEAEAATRQSFEQRLIHYPRHFWLLSDGCQIIGFVNGMVTDEPDLRDEMYGQASLHQEHGAWQMIFGVNTLPQYRRQGRYPGLPAPGLCRNAASPCSRSIPQPRPERPGFDMQGKAFTLLCYIWVCQ